MKKKCLAFFLSIALLLSAFSISAFAASAKHILFLPHQSNSFNILGQYDGASIATDFANSYNIVVADQKTGHLLSNAVVSIAAEYLNDVSLKATITLQNRSEQDATAKIALHSDSKINHSDTPPLFMIPQDVKNAYALRASETYTGGYQCTYQFRNVKGSPDASTVWIGRYDERYDNLWNDGTKTTVSGIDSGMAISWQNINLPVSGAASVSFIVSVEPANLSELPVIETEPKATASPSAVFGPLPSLPPIEKLNPIGGITNGKDKVTSDWTGVLDNIQKAKPGSTVAITMDSESLMPIEVLKRLEKIKNISLQISNESGESFTLTAESAHKAPTEKPLNFESLNQLTSGESSPAADSEVAVPEKEEAVTPSTTKPSGNFALQKASEQTGYLPAVTTIPEMLHYLRRADISPSWAPDIRANTGAMERLYRAALSADTASLSAKERTDCVAYLTQWQQVLGKSPQEAEQLAKDLVG